MRLTLINLIKNGRNNPNGHIYRGKYRIVPPVTKTHFNQLKDDLEREEENMFYLRHCYLSQEQSSGHAKALGRSRESNFVKLVREKTPLLRPHVTIEERLGHVRHVDAWE